MTRPVADIPASDPRELLIRAALLDGTGAVRAWELWSNRIGIENADADSHRLFPLVHDNLSAAGVDASRLGSLRKHRQRSSFAMAVVARDADSAIAALAGAGIEVMLLKGLALLRICYRDPAVRPMLDFDILVRRSAALDAARVLEGSGWRSKRSITPESLAVQHGCEMRRGGRRCDLHWSMMWEQGLAAEDAGWERSRPATFAGCAVRIPDYAELLVHIVVHGTRVGDGRTARWIVDAALLLREVGHEIDWSRVTAICRERGLEYPVGGALSYLRNLVGVDVPEGVTASLESVRPTLMRRMTHVVVPRPPGRLEPFVFIPTLVARFAALSRGRGLRRRIAWMATALQHSWGIDRASALPREVVRRGVRKITRGLVHLLGLRAG